MNARNHITLMGNMRNTPEITNYENGAKIARFALDESTPTQHGASDKHRVFAWGNMAKFIEQHGRKGKELVIHGRVVERTYLSREGKKQRVKEVEVKHVVATS